MSFTFGNTTAAPGLAPTSAPAFGFNTGSFGAPAATSTAPATNFSLGSAQATVSPFGVPAATSSAISFGAPATAAVAPFGAANTNTGVSFGLGSNISTAPTSVSFGGASTAPVTGFTLGAPAASTATSLGFGAGFSGVTGFGTTAPQTSLSSGFGTSLGATPAVGSLTFGAIGSNALCTASGFLSTTSKPLTATPGTTTSTSSIGVGLGGVDVSLSATSGQGSSVDQTADKAVRDNTLPNEILQLIEEYKTHTKQQKLIASEVSRISQKPIHKVEQQIEKIKDDLINIHNRIQSQSSAAEKLRRDSTKTLQDSEMVQRTHDTPLGLQMENMAPDEYFADLTSNIEQELHMFRHEINDMERLLNDVLDPSVLNKDEVVQAVKRLHEIFVALASKLQVEHSCVEQQKEQFLNLRRQLLHDTEDVFQQLGLSSQVTKSKQSISRPKSTSGPPIFSMLGGSLHPLKYGLPTSQLGIPTSTRSAFPASLSFGLGQNTSLLGGNTSSTSFSGSADAVENRPFQLQQPPVGNKRGKR